MNEQLSRIKGKLEKLRQQDKDLKLFGAHKHKYNLNPVASIASIREFEATHQVTLPEGYVTFLTTLGNGGAGPFYGLEPFENALFDDLDYKRPDSLLNPSVPFLHTNPWNLEFEPTVSEEENEQEYNRQYEAFTDEYYAREQMNGAIAISNYGCGVVLHLIVNGDEYGIIWADDRGNDGGIFPSYQLGNDNKITFLDWYEYWLDKSLEKLS